MPFVPLLYRILINECNRILSKTSNTLLVGDFLENNLHGAQEYNHKQLKEKLKSKSL